MNIVHNGFAFQMEDPKETLNPFEIHITLECPNLTGDEILWECTLKGLWEDDSERPTTELSRIWNMHDEGDYFQQTLIRNNRTAHPNLSYTGVFHEMIRSNRNKIQFIRNIFSTSRLPWLSMGYELSIDAQRFWDLQQQNNWAEWIEDELRFRALI
jgi:hypothetical protein